MEPDGIAWEPYPFPDSFVEQILALAAQSGVFVVEHADCLVPEFFGRPGTPRRVIVEEIVRHAREWRRPPDFPALELRVGDRFAAQKPEVREAAMAMLRRVAALDLKDAAGYVTERAVGWARDQALRVALLKGADMLEPPHGGRRPSDMSAVRRLVDDALKVGNNGNLGSHWYATMRGRFVERLMGDECEGRVPTGAAWLNRALRGGSRAGELYVLVGPPKAGKSTALISTIGAGAILAGRKVAHVSVSDVSLAAVEHAYDVRLAGMTTRELREQPDEAQRQLATWRRLGADLQTVYMTGKQATVDAIYGFVSRLRATLFQPDVLIVDFLNRMRGAEATRGGEVDRTGTLVNAAEDLRVLAAECGVAVWTAAQAQRAAFRRRVVGLQHIAWAFELAAIADLFVTLCQTEEEAQADPPTGRWHVAGARGEYQAGAIVPYTFVRETLSYGPGPAKPVGGGVAESGEEG